MSKLEQFFSKRTISQQYFFLHPYLEVTKERRLHIAIDLLAPLKYFRLFQNLYNFLFEDIQVMMEIYMQWFYAVMKGYRILIRWYYP